MFHALSIASGQVARDSGDREFGDLFNERANHVRHSLGNSHGSEEIKMPQALRCRPRIQVMEPGVMHGSGSDRLTWMSLSRKLSMVGNLFDGVGPR